MPVRAKHIDREHFCNVEQNSYPNSEFGMNQDGLMVHIKEFPAGDKSGSGHTIDGANVSFLGSPPVAEGQWTLSKIWERK